MGSALCLKEQLSCIHWSELWRNYLFSSMSAYSDTAVAGQAVITIPAFAQEEFVLHLLKSYSEKLDRP